VTLGGGKYGSPEDVDTVVVEALTGGPELEVGKVMGVLGRVREKAKGNGEIEE
jgi:hypothetical protein